MLKVWIDDMRPAPSEEYTHLATTSWAINFIKIYKNNITELNLDHDAGDFQCYGGDYINILNWMEQYEEATGTRFTFTIKLHTMNPVARDNMMRIIKRRGWNYDF